MRPLKPNRRPVGSLVCAFALLACAPGCAAFVGYRPVPVLVRDAETKKPIPGAEVYIAYPLVESPLAPARCSGAAGEDGIARLRAAPYGDEGAVVTVTAPGYIRAEKTLPIATVRAYEPAGLFEDVTRRPAAVVMELYSEPHPAIELVLPVGYRGEVKAEVHVEEGAAPAPGQRLFRATMLPSGVVPVVGPPLLREVGVNDFRARFADDTPVAASPKDGAVGLWLLSWDGTDRYRFYVGTRADYDDYCRSARHTAIGETRPAGGRGGGHRGGHRGGESGSGTDGSGPSP